MYAPFRIFVSYPEEDAGFMEKIRFLLQMMDVECSVAKHEKAAGDELWDKINSMIKASTLILVLHTRFAPQSKWMERELHIARTHKKRFIPVKEEHVELPSLLRGEDREYIEFMRNDPLTTLMKICENVYNRRLRTPHVVIFRRFGRPIGERLVIVPATNRAYFMNGYLDNLAKKGSLQVTYIDLPRYPANLGQDVWTYLWRLELVRRPPTSEELGFE